MGRSWGFKAIDSKMMLLVLILLAYSCHSQLATPASDVVYVVTLPEGLVAPAGGAERPSAQYRDVECCSYVYKDSRLAGQTQVATMDSSAPGGYNETYMAALRSFDSKVPGLFDAIPRRGGGTGLSRDGRNTVRFGEIDSYPTALAVTATWLECSDSGVNIYDCTSGIVIAEWDQIYNTARYSFDSSDMLYYDLGYVMLHELMHVAGVKDSYMCPTTTVMYYSVPSGSLASRRHLDALAVSCLAEHGYAVV